MNLFNTTVFRLAIKFAAVFAVVSVTTLLSVYFITIHEIETQTERELLHDLIELENVYKEKGLATLKELISRRDQYGEHLHHYYALTDSNNNLLAGSVFLTQFKTKADFTKFGISFYDFAEYINAEGHKIIVRFAVKTFPNHMMVYVGQAQNSLTELREHTFTALLYAVMITLILAVIIGAYMGRVVLSRIKIIDEGLQNAINSDFKQNLPISTTEDEFQALTKKLNVMLARIENLLHGMRQVTDNIAHDLRSPLNRMRSRLEVTLLQQRDVEEYKDVMQKAVDDCDQLLRTFNSLLSIAQLESGVSRDNKESIDLSQLTDELADLYQFVAEEKGLEFIWGKPSYVCTIMGIRQSIAQAINNLLENAIKYTPAGGKIELKVYQTGKQVTVEVNDSGPGIPIEFREKALQRFQRLDSARSEPGNGLGLSLVNAVVKLHNAKLVLDDNHPGLSVKLIFKCLPTPMPGN